MKTDNSNIVVENFQNSANKYLLDNSDEAKRFAKMGGKITGTYYRGDEVIELIEGYSNWQKERYKDLVQSHAELLDILKTAKQELWENEKGWNRIDNAIEKAEKINIQ